MSKEAGGPREPMDKSAGMVGQIETSMSTCNVGKKGGPGVHSYSNTHNDGGKGGSSSIQGPGWKGNNYPVKAPKETKL